MPCVTHHTACDCREEGHAAELAALREQLAAAEKERDEARERFRVFEHEVMTGRNEQHERLVAEKEAAWDSAEHNARRARSAEAERDALAEKVKALTPPLADEASRGIGWTLDYDYCRKLADSLRTDEGGPPMETVEAVLCAYFGIARPEEAIP